MVNCDWLTLVRDRQFVIGNILLLLFSETSGLQFVYLETHSSATIMA